MSKLLDVQYYFNVLPGAPDLAFWRVVFAGAVAAVLLAVLAIFIGRKNRTDNIKRAFWRKVSIWGFVAAAVALILAFFRFENVYFLSMRFLIFLWILAVAAWGALILKYRFRDMPAKMKRREEHRAYTQYLPGRK